MLFAREDELRPEDFPEHLHAATAGRPAFAIPLNVTMEEIEREAIVQTLARTGGNVKKTAEILDYHRPTLYRKLRKFGLIGDGPAEEEGGEDAAAE